MIRVAIISEPGFAGVKRHVVDLLHHLDVREFELLFLYSLERKDAHYEEEIQIAQARGIRCVEVALVREIRPWADLQSGLKVWQELRDFRPCIAHLHSSKAGFLGRFAAKLAGTGIRTIYTPNALACFDSRLFWWLEKAAGLVTDRIVGVSPSETDDIRRWRLVPEARVACIPLCVRTLDEYPPRRTGLTEKPLIVGSGRICRQKQALLFFKTAAVLLREHPALRFRWIGNFGDDEEAREVRALIARDALARQVEVTGWVSDADAEIAAADVFCMTSRYESFGYVTADAMIMGVPVVGVNATGTRDLVIDGVTGLLCGPVTSQLAECVLRLLQDAALRFRLAAAARGHVAGKFSREQMIRDISRLYRDVARSPNN